MDFVLEVGGGRPEVLLLSVDDLVVYYESINRELKIRCIYECRCDERLQTKTNEFTRLTHTGLVVELRNWNTQR
jgi:hypothetical protein